MIWFITYIDFTILHPNALCAHTSFSPETLTAKSFFLCGQRSFLGFEVSDALLWSSFQMIIFFPPEITFYRPTLHIPLYLSRSCQNPSSRSSRHSQPPLFSSSLPFPHPTFPWWCWYLFLYCSLFILYPLGFFFGVILLFTNMVLYQQIKLYIRNDEGGGIRV